MKSSYFCYSMGFAFLYFAFGGVFPLISTYLEGIGFSGMQIGTVIASGTFLTLGAQPILGAISDRVHNPKKVTLITIAIMIAICAVLSFNRNFAFIVVFYGLMIAMMNGVVPLTDNIALGSPHDYGKIRMWGSIGFAIAAQIGGVIYEELTDKSMFILFIIGMAITFMFFLTVTNPKVSVDEEKNKEKVPYKEIFSNVLKNKHYLLFLAVTFFMTGANETHLVYFGLLFKEMGGAPTALGTTFLLFTVSEIPFIFLADKIIKRCGIRPIVIATCAIYGARFMWYSTLPSPFIVQLTAVIQGISLGLFIVSSVHVVGSLIEPKYRNTAMSLVAMMGLGLGAMVYQLLGGYLMDIYGAKAIYFVIGALSFVALVIFLFIKIPDENSRSQHVEDVIEIK
ncbi:PPP family 3-phenylpropionic acid transporter [Serratia fonticola]|jgi:oligosaccharide:H+ symporter|uniref:PPP family 3-phenylpropionic acid transporter n=1 Tax=Serratia fonticola TaxID=47917 RepID=A0A559TAE7_SERFO|nr:MFS transporter [Serratia fonticola]TQI80898.1 PPP family 3-phenylpropionic acid transporter [Serratia fonticola]TQI97077.1 PPP family 3-phenylpropionic acid transporter [Serratia fonticola]TVZ71573.1 PPP family 3-phenylpropionic acid transporter [Serratia fonticola]